VLDAGYKNSDAASVYPFFINTIYLGAYSDMTPKSFTGYLKDVKLITAYHGFAQMADEKLRNMRYYSYDEPKLVAYWKLSENYGSSDLQYTIKDYSANRNSISYSTVSEPDYPVFVYDASNELNLCTFHDV